MAWRDHPYWHKGYLFLLNPTVVFQARVNMSTITYPLAAVYFDTVTTGAYTNALSGMTVLFGSTPGGDDLGRQRLRANAESTYLRIGMSSQGVRDGEVNISDNSYITVLDDYRIWAKIPRIMPDGTRYKDYVLSPGYNCTQQEPVANTNGAYAGFVDPDTEVIEIVLSATGSFAVADSATITGYQWDVDDGTITVGTDTSASITCTFPPGFRWIHLTVTDSNGHSHTTHTPIFAATRAGATAPITNFHVESHSMTLEGQNISFRVFENIPVTTYPDGTLVMYWEEEYYNGVRGSLEGDSGREHVKFVGWHNTDSARIEATSEDTLSDTVLECVDAAGRLRILPGFTQIVERTATPLMWEEMSTPDLAKYIHYLLHWHSTVLDVAYFDMAAVLSSYTFTTLGSDGVSLYAQVDRVAQAAACRLTCDKNGRLHVLQDQMLVAPGSRSATILETLTEDDWVSISYTHTRPARYHWLHGSAIVAGTANKNDPDLHIDTVFCMAPGEAPGQGEVSHDQGEQIVLSQAELNQREGLRYATRLNPFESYFEVALAHAGDIGIDPAKMNQWIRLTISAGNAAQRGLSFTTERFLIYGVTVDYDPDANTKNVTLSLERERSGSSAITYIPPTPDETAPPDTTPPDVYIPPTTSYGPGTKAGLLVLNIYHAVNTLGGRVYYSEEMSGGIWTPLHGGLTPVATNRYGTMVDGFLNPSNTNEAFLIISNTMMPYSSTPNGQGGVYRNRSWKTGGDWEVMISNDAINTLLGTTQWQILSANTTIAAEGCIYLLIHSLGLSQTLVVRTMDYGATIAKSPALKVLGTADIRNGGVWVGATNANKVIVGARGSGGRIGVWVSEWGSFAPIDGGLWDAKWSEDTSLDAGVMPMVPYLRWDGTVNTGETEMYIIGIDNGVKRSTDGGSTFADWVPDGDCDVMFVRAHVTHQGVGAFSVSAFQPGQAGFWLKDPGKLRIAAGDPAGYVEKTLPLAQCTWAGGWPGNNSQFYIGSPWFWKDYLNPNGTPIIMFSNDGANNFTDWTGNLWTYHALDAAAGLVRVSPDWLDT
jgi:hypothetical protein